jgi:hypothetical protein
MAISTLTLTNTPQSFNGACTIKPTNNFLYGFGASPSTFYPFRLSYETPEFVYDGLQGVISFKLTSNFEPCVLTITPNFSIDAGFIKLEQYKQDGETNYNLAYDRARAEFKPIVLTPNTKYNFDDYELKMAANIDIVGDKTSILEFSYPNGSTKKAIWQAGMAIPHGFRLHIKCTGFSGGCLYRNSEYVAYSRNEASNTTPYLADSSYRYLYAENIHCVLFDSNRTADMSWTGNANNTASCIINESTGMDGGLWGHGAENITVQGKIYKVVNNIIDDKYPDGYSYPSGKSRTQSYVSSGRYVNLTAYAPIYGVFNDVKNSGGSAAYIAGEIAGNVYIELQLQSVTDYTNGTWESRNIAYENCGHSNLYIAEKWWDFAVRTGIDPTTGLHYKPFSVGNEGVSLGLNPCSDLNFVTVTDYEDYIDFRGEYKFGAYNQNGTAVTVNEVGHGLTNGQSYAFYKSTGSFTSGYFTVTVADANNYSFTHTVSTGAISGILKHKGIDTPTLRNAVQVGMKSINNAYGSDVTTQIQIGIDLIGSGAGGYFTYSDMSKLMVGCNYLLPMNNTTARQFGLYKHSANAPAFYIQVIGLYENRKLLIATPLTSGTTATNTNKSYGVAFAVIGTNAAGMVSANTLLNGNFWTNADGSPYAIGYADTKAGLLGYATYLAVLDADVADGKTQMVTDLLGYPNGVLLTHKTGTGWVDGNGIALVGTTLVETKYRKSVTTLAAVTATAVYSCPIATFRSINGVIQVGDGTNFAKYTVNAIHNGTTASGSVTQTQLLGTSPSSFTVDVNGGNLRIMATPASSTTTTYKVDINPEYI